MSHLLIKISWIFLPAGIVTVHIDFAHVHDCGDCRCTGQRGKRVQSPFSQRGVPEVLPSHTSDSLKGARDEWDLASLGRGCVRLQSQSAAARHVYGRLGLDANTLQVSSRCRRFI